ncbi:hypothetical protein Np450711_030 [Cyanophage S-RIM14]|uniref:Uncharacterized protein n=1 Tax=Cyanophage S-RIM14 TaxID=1278423 RepID=A0A1D7SJU1_9CAUD|nr:hypothetical protein Np450711_030 [Cyanophage S-RIM14]
MGRLNVTNIAGLDTSVTVEGVTVPQFNVHVNDPLRVDGTLQMESGAKTLSIPNAPANQRPLKGTRVGSLFYNETENRVEAWDGTNWVASGTGASSTSTLGLPSNPAPSGQHLNYAGFETGYYYIQPNNESSAYRMYVDNRRYAGGWVCAVVVRIEDCQSHVTNNQYGTFTRTDGYLQGPIYDAQVTIKMADSFIQNLRNSSLYRGQTPYWLESGHWTGNYGPINQFFPYAMTIDLANSASNQNARTNIALQYEGQFNDRNPNTGTHGMGDHHTGGTTYFAYGRHPEQGTNCGLRQDTLGQANGWFWVK